MQCNIDRRGRVARLCSGILVVVVGVLLMIFWAREGWKWAVSGVVVAGGLFQIYEAWAGWCVMRAMGFKTPM